MQTPETVILLATYNGERFLHQQIESLAVQTVDRVHVYVSDDGSTDSTRDILTSWKRRWRKGEFEILKGPNRGFAANFQSLVVRVKRAGDFFAFCDQDDVWDVDKLERAIVRIKEEKASVPILYCSKTRNVDQSGKLIGSSRRFRTTPSFRNALVQSVASGNTMVMNDSAWAVLVSSCRRTDFVAHDWWSYIIVSGAGGRIIYSSVPSLSYRQHETNAIGSSQGWKDRLRRFRSLTFGEYKRFTTKNLAGLNQCLDLLTPQNRCALRKFEMIRSPKLITRLEALRASGVYRQAFFGQITLYAASVFKWI